jgi:hypothetical protein
MRNFFALTSLADRSSVLVNMDDVSHIGFDRKQRTIVHFAGDFDVALKVRESPQEIATKLAAREGLQPCT